MLRTVRTVAKGKYEKWLEPDGLLLLQSWARDGLTDEQIAGNMGISHTTLYEWRKKYPNISEALKRARKLWTLKLRTPCISGRLDTTTKNHRGTE